MVGEIEKKPELGISGSVDIRKGLLQLEEAWKSEDGHSLGDDWVDRVEGGGLEHQFINGLYVRMVHLPAGMFFTTKIHKVRHPYFVLHGKCRILTEEGVVDMIAPHHGITEPGTKRLMYIVEDVVWYTVHATDKTTPEEVEEEVIAKDYGEFKMEVKDLKKLKGE